MGNDDVVVGSSCAQSCTFVQSGPMRHQNVAFLHKIFSISLTRLDLTNYLLAQFRSSFVKAGLEFAIFGIMQMRQIC
jgi:hypothetical protein